MFSPNRKEGPMEATEAQDKTQQTSDPKKGKSAASIVALVLGIIALVTSFLPIINNLSFVLALVGAIFAVIGLVGVLRGKRGGRGFSIAAVIVNVLAIAIVLGTQSACHRRGGEGHHLDRGWLFGGCREHVCGVRRGRQVLHHRRADDRR